MVDADKQSLNQKEKLKNIVIFSNSMVKGIRMTEFDKFEKKW